MARRKPQATQEALLAAATRLFAAHGYDEVTVDAIAEAAGVTKGAFYYWFRDKADIARDVRHRFFDAVTTRTLERLPVTDDVLETLESGFSDFLGALSDLGDARQFLLETWRMPADAEGPFDHERGVELVAELLRHAVETGQIPRTDPQPLAVFFVGGCSELARYALASGETNAAAMALRQMLHALRVVQV